MAEKAEKERLLGEIARALHAVPAAGAVHVRRDPGDVLDHAGIDPLLELEVVGFGVPLVAHLRGDLVLLRGGHHQLDLTEAVGHRLLAVDVLSLRHRQHGDGEVREIRDSHAHGVDVVAHGVEHGAEVAESRDVRKELEHLLRVRGFHVGVAERHDGRQARVMKRRNNFLPAVADAAARQPHLIACPGGPRVAERAERARTSGDASDSSGQERTAANRVSPGAAVDGCHAVLRNGRSRGVSGERDR